MTITKETEKVCPLSMFDLLAHSCLPKQTLALTQDEWEEFNDTIEAKYGSVQVNFLASLLSTHQLSSTEFLISKLIVQDGFNMVFGKDASVGYVCGIESAVKSAGSNTADQKAKVCLESIH